MDKVYYAAFGEYILDKNIFVELNKYKEKNSNSEVPNTELLFKTYQNNIYSFIPTGEICDVGNIDSYINTIKNYKEK